MKRVLATGFLMTSLLVLYIPQAYSDHVSDADPPIAQILVREGDFAMELARELRLGAPRTEIEAESFLSAVGIAPYNGWMADYPVTPLVLGALETSIVTAVASGKLSMSRSDALGALSRVCSSVGLPIRTAEDSPAETPADPDQYVGEDAVSSYYYDEGPPVISYYAPPWDYYYLYDWIPYPFWYSGLFFPGFFILGDFDLVVHHHHYHRPHHHHRFRDRDRNHYKRVTNHRFDRDGRLFRVDPRSVNRRTIATVRSNDNGSPIGRSNSAYMRGAQSILNRDSSRFTSSARSGENVTNRGALRSSSFNSNRGAFAGTDNYQSDGNRSLNRPFPGNRQSGNSPARIRSGGRSGFRGPSGLFGRISRPRSSGNIGGGLNHTFRGDLGRSSGIEGGGRGFSAGPSQGGGFGGSGHGSGGGLSHGGGLGGGGHGGFGGGGRR